MTARWRKAIGSVFTMLFLAAYIWAVCAIGDHVPKAWWAQLVYFMVAGTAWGVPLIPLITWMNRGR
jgi:hypothetical protein